MIYHQLFRKVCLSYLSIRDLYANANSCLQVTVMITPFRALTLTTPPLTPAPQNALREPCFPACPPRHPCSYPRKFSSELETEAEVIFMLPIELISGESGTGELRLGRRGFSRLRPRAGKAPLYTSFLAHLLTGDHPILVYTCTLVAIPSSCAVSGNVTMPWQPTVTPAVPLAHTSLPSSYLLALKRLRPSLLGVSA